MRAWTGWAGLNCCSFTFQTMQRTLEFGILPLQHSGLKLLAVDGASGWLGICDLLVWQDLSVFSFLLKCEHHNEQHQYCYSSILALSYCRHWKKQSAVFCCCITNSDLFHNYCTCHPLRCQENDLATRMCQCRTGQWSQHVCGVLHALRNYMSEVNVQINRNIINVLCTVKACVLPWFKVFCRPGYTCLLLAVIVAASVPWSHRSLEFWFPATCPLTLVPICPGSCYPVTGTCLRMTTSLMWCSVPLRVCLSKWYVKNTK